MYGGLAQLGGNASGNTVTISGGTINKYVYGGSADSGTASNNTVNIYGGTFKSDTRLYGGFSDDSSGNTLNFYTKGITVDKLGYFQNLSFYVPEDTTDSGEHLSCSRLFRFRQSGYVPDAFGQTGIQRSQHHPRIYTAQQIPRHDEGSRH